MAKERLKDEIILLDIDDIMHITGWGENSVRKIMKEKDFPLLQIGKKNQVLLESFKEYLIKRGKLNLQQDKA